MTRDDHHLRALLARAELRAPADGPSWDDVLDRRTATRKRAGVRRAVAVAALLVAALALGLTAPWRSDPGLVERAAAAIQPADDEILHVKTVTATPDGPYLSEVWWLDPGSSRWIQGPVSGPTESAVVGEDHLVYRPGQDAIVSVGAAGASACVPVPFAGASVPGGCPDPLSGMRLALERGTAQVAGQVERDGRSALKLTFPGTLGPLVVYVDAQTLLPILVIATDPAGGSRTTEFQTFERLPADRENRRLLDLRAQHPRATVASGATVAP